MLISRILSFTLACLLLVQSMPTLVEVVAFTANREALTQRHCVNIAAPTLDCRAACYLADQVAEIGQKLHTDTPNQATDNTVPNTGPLYVLPTGITLQESIKSFLPDSQPFTRQLDWSARYLDVASPPPLA